MKEAPEGFTLVPNTALEWLFGAAPDPDGKWFGECEDAERATLRKYPHNYWWRSKFRKLIGAAEPTTTAKAGNGT